MPLRAVPTARPADRRAPAPAPQARTSTLGTRKAPDTEGSTPERPACEDLGAARSLLVCAFLVAAMWYLVWRLHTLNPEALGLSIVILAAEAFLFVGALLRLYTTWRLTVREAPAPQGGLAVDLFVTTVDEPVETVRRTLLAARNMEYAHQTWLLDDGNRPEMRRLAAALRCRYVSRNDPAQGRAGCLNNALRFSAAELVALFDADHAPARRFLIETLGYFRDAGIAFVQTPLDFYNLDSFAHRRERARRLVWTERSLFFRVIQRGRDWRGAALLCGSCAVIRRSALDYVGGFAASTATEALHTSLKLHKRGFRSVYHPRSLAFGLAPTGVATFVRERMHWGIGAMQVWRRERIFTSRRLTPAQKLCYFAQIAGYLDGWAKAVLYLAPVVVLLRGTLPFAAPVEDFLLHFVPCYLLGAWMLEELGRGYARTLAVAQYGMARFGAYLWATSGLFRPRARLRVIAAPEDTPQHDGRYLAPQWFVLIANAAAILLGAALHFTADVPTLAALALGALWAAANAALAAAVIRHSRRHGAYRRHEYRFPIPIPARVHFAGEGPVLGIFDDVSSSGFRFYGAIPPHLAAGRRIDGELFLPSGPLAFRAHVRSEVRDRPGGRAKCIRCSFAWADEAGRDRLDAHLYGSDLQVELNDLDEQHPTPLGWLAQAVAGRRAETRIAAVHWAPVLYHDAASRARGPQVAFVSVPENEAAPRTLVTLRPLDPRADMRFRMVTRVGSRRLDGKPVPLRNLDTPAAPVYLYQFAA
ncbi:MAG TPA: glycosyltransferase [Burkholderiales bacterium]|nr:glycosyltransferase [Burkholderiales bacterium]